MKQEMEHSITTHSEEQTMKEGRRLGEKTVPGDIVLLSGDLGAGKTHFVKGFAGAFGISPEQVSSPTFNLVQEYRGNREVPLYHMDCYRIEHPGEALEFGIEEYFYGEGVSIIEWPEKIRSLLPDEVIRVALTILDETTRHITISYPKEQGSK